MSFGTTALSLEAAAVFPMEGSARQLDMGGAFAQIAANNSGSFNPGVDRVLDNILAAEASL